MSKSKKNYILGKVVHYKHFSSTFLHETWGSSELDAFEYTVIRSNPKYQFVNQTRLSGEVLFYIDNDFGAEWIRII